ncbi:kinetochore protein-like protein Mis13 [Cryomyces antarcticus]
MTSTLTRAPLQTLSMTSSQPGTRRRSARLAFDEENDAPKAAKRTKTEAVPNGSGSQQATGRANGTAGNKAKIAYDEDADGFQFTRKARAKKAIAKPTTAADPLRPESIAVAPAPTKKKKKKTLPSSPAPEEPKRAPKRRRSARLSGDNNEHSTEVDKLTTAKAESTDESAKENQAQNEDPFVAHSKTPGEFNGDSMNLVAPGSELHVEKRRDPTKIALPFADTPVIRRNKEMRKNSGQTSRRSSSGMRGRRASSLMDSGTSNAVPHAEVETSEFYKHISQDLPEPRRMKQLLTWCGTRALPEKPSGSVPDTNAILAARVIQEELLKEFANKSAMSDWFNREETAPAVIVKKPNPRNIQNAAKLEELEADVKRLQEEKAAWEDLLKQSFAATSSSKDAPSHDQQQTPHISTDPNSIDASLLDPEQAAILQTLISQGSPLLSSTQSRLQDISSSLEFKIDQFADGVHKLEQYRQAAERVADRILAVSAEKLEEREKRSLEKNGLGKVDGIEVLRSLSRAIKDASGD